MQHLKRATMLTLRVMPTLCANPLPHADFFCRCFLPVQDILIGQAKFVDNHTVKYGLPGRVDVGGQVTAKDIIIATGSVPFVPPGARAGTRSSAAACSTRP